MGSEWYANSLRLTAFYRDQPSGFDTIFRDITGQPPESDDHRPREVIRRQIGPYRNGQLEVVTNPIRVDIVVVPKAQPTDAVSILIGPYEQELGHFAEIAHSWLASTALRITRLAFGAVFLSPEESRKAAYLSLGSLLPFLPLDPETTSELIYRVNHPRPSRVLGPDHKLNRLTTWAAILARAFIMPGGAPSGAVSLSDEHFVRLEVDNSTRADQIDPLPKEQLVPIYDELVEMGVDSVKSGAHQ